MNPDFDAKALMPRSTRFLQTQGQWSRKQEPTRLGRSDGVDGHGAVALVQSIDRNLEGVRLGQQRRDVLEQDARFGKIRDVADILCQVHTRFPRSGVGTAYRFAEGQATMSVAVRRAGPGDAAVIAEFNRRLAAETEGLTLDAAVLRAGVEAGLADEHKALYFVAEDGGEGVGQMVGNVGNQDGNLLGRIRHPG